jgi:hypothetical protein
VAGQEGEVAVTPAALEAFAVAYAGASYQTKIDPPTGEFLLNNHTTGGHRMRPQMATTRQYRGYDIVPMRQWSQWCVGIYPTRADLPILARSTLSNLASKKEDAVTEAKQKIDRILARLNYPYGK